jgi:RHS repeat-associated protein
MSYSPSGYPNSLAFFSYTLDALERPTGMTDIANNTWAAGVTYNAANQPSFGGRTYNNLFQLTQVGQMTYNYSATKNNGQIASSVDGATGETIAYQYDALKRLLSASGKNWGETYTYDGFGNMTQMAPTGTAGAPSLSVTVDPTTNRLAATASGYDNNGNLTYGFGINGIYYDAANRVSALYLSGFYYYGYDSDNRRIYYRDNNNDETVYLYGADGKKLTSYTATVVPYLNYYEVEITPAANNGNVYFAGIMLAEEGNPVTTDRLGSARSGGPGGLGYQAEYPYGVEYTTTANDREKYATYTRDSLTGLDYAMNRYYSSQWGRFLSPDPYSASASPGTPQSWNRYSYVVGDPLNGNDPSGLCGINYFGLTGPPVDCNNIQSIIAGMTDANGNLAFDTYTSPPPPATTPGNYLSQVGAPNVFDQGIVGENAYLYGNAFQGGIPDPVGVYMKWYGTSDPPGYYFGNIDSNGFLQIWGVPLRLPPLQFPSPLNPLGNLSTSPTQPKMFCESGYHAVWLNAFDGTCAPNTPPTGTPARSIHDKPQPIFSPIHSPDPASPHRGMKPILSQILHF